MAMAGATVDDGDIAAVALPKDPGYSHELHLEVYAFLCRAAGSAFNPLPNYDEHEPRCFEGTRNNLVREVIDWAENGRHPILGVHGVPSIGKTAFCRTLSRELDKKSFLGGCFYFKAGTNRANLSKFCIMLAAQILQRVRGYAAVLKELIDAEPDIAQQGLKEQWAKLILQPLIAVTMGHDIPLIIIIDSIDECESTAEAALLMKMFSCAKDMGLVYLRAVITYRPDMSARLAFAALEGSCDMIEMHNYNVSEITSGLKAFVKERLTTARDNYNRSVSQHQKLPEAWPNNDDVFALALLSHPVYGYADIACRFVEDWGSEDPKQRLDAISRSLGRCLASQLEELYVTAFKRAPLNTTPKGMAQFRRVVGSVAVLNDSLSASRLARLLNIDVGKVHEVLHRLHCVINIPKNYYDPISCYSAHLREFLLGTDTEYAIDNKYIHGSIVADCLRVMSRMLTRNIAAMSHPGQTRAKVHIDVIVKRIPPELKYACSHWVEHLRYAGILQDDNGPIMKFFEVHFLHWLEVMTLIGQASMTLCLLRLIKTNIKPTNSHRLLAFIEDTEQMITQNAQIIESHPLQIYCSILPFAPQDSIVAEACSQDLVPWMALRPSREEHWGRFHRTFDGHSDTVTSVAFSPDSKFLVTGSEDGTVQIWHVEDGNLITTLTGHKGPVNSVTFSPDGARVISGSSDKTVKIWSVWNGKVVESLLDPICEILTVACSPDSKLIALGSDYGNMWVWSFISKEYIHSLEGSWGAANSVAFSPDSAILASATEDYMIRLWSVEHGNCMHILEGHTQSAVSVTFAPNNEYLASSSLDGTVRVWRLSDRSCVRTLECVTFMTSISFSPDSAFIATASANFQVQIWGTESGICERAFRGHGDDVNAVAFSPNSRFLASASSDTTARTWCLDHELDLPKCDDYQDGSRIIVIKFSPDYGLVGSGSVNGSLRVWNAKTGNLKHTLQVPGGCGYIEDIKFSPDSKFIASTSYGSTIRLWNVSDGRCIWSFEQDGQHIPPVSFSPDSKTLAFGSHDGVLQLLSISKGSIREFVGHESAVTACEFSHDSSMVASGDCDGVLRIWKRTSGKCARSHPLHESRVNLILFSADSSLVASTSDDWSARVLDLKKGGDSYQSYRSTREFNSVAFSPDLSMLIASVRGDLVHVWQMNPIDCLCTKKVTGVGASDVRFGSSDSRLLSAKKTIMCEEIVSKKKSKRTRSISAYVPACLRVTSDNHWITWGDDDLVWLPFAARPSCWVAHGSTIAIGCSSGRVLIIRFDGKLDSPKCF